MADKETEVIRAAQSGNTQAFRQLVQVYDRGIMRTVRNFTACPEDAQDIYQEVFLRAWRSLPQFRFECAFRTWLYRICVNVCISQQNGSTARNTSRLRVNMDSETLEAIPAGNERSDRGIESAEIRRGVELALQQLSPRQRLVFTLRFLQEYSIQEIAAVLECSTGNVKRHLFDATERVRQNLRKLLT